MAEIDHGVKLLSATTRCSPTRLPQRVVAVHLTHAFVNDECICVRIMRNSFIANSNSANANATKNT